MNTKTWNHHWFGFFKPEGYHSDILPKLEDFQYEGEPPEDIEKIINYLETSPVVISSLCIHENCDLCGNYKYDPGSFHFDGVWLWPTLVNHYVKSHRIILPDAFMERIRHKDYIPPDKVCSDFDQLPWPPLEPQDST